MRFLLFTVSPASEAAPAASSQKDKRSASAANAWQQEEQGPGAGSRLRHHLSLAPSACSACPSCLLDLHTATPHILSSARDRFEQAEKDWHNQDENREQGEPHRAWQVHSGGTCSLRRCLRKGRGEDTLSQSDGSVWGVISAVSGIDLHSQEYISVSAFP